jgi:protein-tyrosine phosphatase
MLDFHNHLIPGVDDGASDLESSIEGIAVMNSQGIDRIITTPHLRAGLLIQDDELSNYLTKVAHSWNELYRRATSSFPKLALARGFEILLDVPKPILHNPLLRLGGSRFALVEFPFLAIPPHSDQALFDLKIQGYEPIVAHPERYRDIHSEPHRVDSWRRVGAHLQANAGSFLGKYGPEAESAVWTLLEQGALSYVCSDYHATGPCDSENAFDLIATRHGHWTAESLFSSNPTHILEGQSPTPVVPPRRKRMRLLERLGFTRKTR